jgi:hypothetical protein
MKKEDSWKLADKMLADMEILLDQLGLTKGQRDAAHRMSEQLLLHASQLRKSHVNNGVKRSVKTEIAALGMAAIHRATVHRMNRG